MHLTGTTQRKAKRETLVPAFERGKMGSMRLLVIQSVGEEGDDSLLASLDHEEEGTGEDHAQHEETCNPDPQSADQERVSLHKVLHLFVAALNSSSAGRVSSFVFRTRGKK